MSMTPSESSKLEFPAAWQKPAMPGFGTFPWPHVTSERNYREVARSMQCTIEAALTLGYHHLDTAFTYGNQDLVGAAVRAAGVHRNQLFVTSKLHPNNNNYREAIEKILEAIALVWGEACAPEERYLDAFLLHYPGNGDPLEAWKALQEAKSKALVRHIGVSNFEIWHIDRISHESGVVPEINQIEFHPWIYQEQKDLLRYCHQHEIVVEGYSPLAQGKYLQSPVLKNLAHVHQATPARILLKWCMQHGVRPIVGSRNTDHLRSNAESYDFELRDSEMEELNSLGSMHPLRIAEQWRWNPKVASFGEKTRRNTVKKFTRQFLKRILSYRHLLAWHRTTNEK